MTAHSHLDISARTIAQMGRRWRLSLMFVAALGWSCTAAGSGVPWEDYSPTVRTRIDALASAKDCAGLQAEFDIADANNAATRERTGHNNADLMSYIDKKMRKAGCYG